MQRAINPDKASQHHPQQKEKRMEIVLHCAAREFYLHQGINKQTKK